MVFRILFALAAAIALIAPAAAAEPIDIGSRLELFVDDALIEKMDGVELRLHEPTPREVVMVHDAPWEGNCTAHHTLFRDGDVFRMYYGGHHYDEKNPKMRHPVICLALSQDGIHWMRPELGLFEYEGSKKNNIVWMGDVWSKQEQRDPFGIFKDTNPDCMSDAQYKSVARGDDGVYALKSPDGIHWSLMSEKPVIPKGWLSLDSQNLSFWDATRSRYVCFLRAPRKPPGGGNGIRDVATCTSTDFLHWTEPKLLEYPGAPLEHLYTNQIAPYYRAPHIFLGFPKRFVPSRKVPWDIFSGVSDAVFMSSRDGLNFKRWGEAIIRPGLQKDCWVNRNHMTGWGILVTKSDVPGTPDELSIYSNEGYYRGPAVRLRRFTYRIDGFVSVQTPLAGGEFVTKPLVFSGKELVMNYSTSAAGSVRVEIQNAKGEPLPGFTLAESPEIFGDAIEQTVSWKNGADVSRLAGAPVRLRFVMKDADLYSICFKP